MPQDYPTLLQCTWPFTKMEGLGNDFVVLDGVRRDFPLDPLSCRRIADRHYGIGCDQILLVEPASSPDADFRYRIFNADGSEVGQCGNGARCFAVFVRRAGLTDKSSIRVETASGPLQLQVHDDGLVTVDMGVPRLDPAHIPFAAPAPATDYCLELESGRVEFAAVGMGNPHALIRVADVGAAPVAALGPLLEHHPAFPERTNVGFLEIVSPREIRLRTWERGAGETLACGSNACAAVVAGRGWGALGEEVRVDLPGGSLEIRWPGPGQHLQMTGPARVLFDGVWQGLESI